jgi:hypothetical protein
MIAARRLVDQLLALGFAIRDRVISGRDLARDPLPIGIAAGDMVFAIDRRVEPLVLAAMAELPEALQPVLVVCEGLGEDGCRWIGPTDRPLQFRIIIDPIDGTRSLAYDKRSAWFLAAAVPDVGESTRLGDAVASVMVELPTSKQAQADHFVFAAGDWMAFRRDLREGSERPLPVRPTGAPTLRHGFGSVSSFFPGTQVLAAELSEEIATSTLGAESISDALVWNDQYISTGGQMVELVSGRDRFICDLRPIFYRILQKGGATAISGLCCHPYDLAGLPIARAAGIILTDGYGGPLDVPLDVVTPVHWCGYASPELRDAVEPIVQTWITRQLT